MFIANTITLRQESQEMLPLNWPFRAWHNYKQVVAWLFFCLHWFRLEHIVHLKPTLCYFKGVDKGGFSPPPPPPPPHTHTHTHTAFIIRAAFKITTVKLTTKI